MDKENPTHTPPPGMESDASRLVEEWQKHFSGMMNDNDAVHAMLVLVERMQRFYHFPTGMPPAFPAPFFGMPHAPNAAQQPQQPGRDGRHQPRDDGAYVAPIMGMLANRITELEQRVAELERQLAGRAKPPAP